MRAKKWLTSRQIFRYAVPARTVTKKALACSMLSCCRKASERFKPLPGQSGMGLVEIWKDSQQDTARRRVWNRLPLSVLGDFQLEASKSCCHFLYKYKSLT